MTPSECKEWGFTEPSCADCDSLGDFVTQEPDLLAACAACCVTPDLQKYHSAHLIVDMQRIGRWPELQSFLNSKADAFKHVLKVKDVWNTWPSLKLKHDGGSDALRVDLWKAGQLEEFLSERVVAKTKGEAVAQANEA